MYISPLLTGKRCVITGGSRGIGLAIARLFAAQGAACTLVGRKQQGLEEAIDRLNEDEIERERGKALTAARAKGANEAGEGSSSPSPPPQQSKSHAHKIAQMDVSHPDQWKELITRLKTEKVDILVNAAGVTQNAFLYSDTVDDVRQILDTNLLGTTLGCKFMIMKMMKQKGGCIINVASVLATHGGRGASVYAASKAGIVALTRSLASEVTRFGIRANVLLPGYIRTEMTKGMHKDLASRIPMGRLGSVEEVADAALFLAKNTYAHNCVLNIDGGLSGT